MTSRISVQCLMAGLVLVACFAPGAKAQSYYAGGFVPSIGYGYGGYYGGYQASTAAEGYLRGQAALLQARGIASIYYAQALNELEVARSLNLENRRAYLQFRADHQEVLEARREQKREESIRRLEQRQQRLAAERRAAAEQAEKITIDWPAAITGKSYEPIRREIEGLANLRLELGENAGESSELAIRHAVRELAKQIMADEDADHMSDEQSQVVRPFVRGLAANIFDATPQQPTTLTIAAVSTTQR